MEFKNRHIPPKLQLEPRERTVRCGVDYRRRLKHHKINKKVPFNDVYWTRRLSLLAKWPSSKVGISAQFRTLANVAICQKKCTSVVCFPEVEDPVFWHDGPGFEMHCTSSLAVESTDLFGLLKRTCFSFICLMSIVPALKKNSRY